MKNKKLTICLSYYNQKRALRKVVEGWTRYPDEVKESFTFFIVDDCSYWGSALSVLEGQVDLSSLDLHIYRVEQDLYCNISGARNLAAMECNTEWMMILDVDTVMSKEVSEQVLAIINTPKELSKDAYKFNRVRRKNGKPYEKPHPACCLIRTEDYWGVGGCNEDLVGKYGGTDADFWNKWVKAGLKIFTFKDIYLRHFEGGQAPGIDRNSNRERVHNALPSPPKYVRFPWKKIYPYEENLHK